MKIKQVFLIFGFFAVSIIALLYGVSPKWFARTFLGVADLDLNFAHILRAVMCLYLVLGLFWLYAAFSDRYRNTGVLIIGLFAGGLAVGRIISLFLDGQPSPILVLYVMMELALVPIAFRVFRLPE